MASTEIPGPHFYIYSYPMQASSASAWTLPGMQQSWTRREVGAVAINGGELDEKRGGCSGPQWGGGGCRRVVGAGRVGAMAFHVFRASVLSTRFERAVRRYWRCWRGVGVRSHAGGPGRVRSHAGGAYHAGYALPSVGHLAAGSGSIISDDSELVQPPYVQSTLPHLLFPAGRLATVTIPEDSPLGQSHVAPDNSNASKSKKKK